MLIICEIWAIFKVKKERYFVLLLLPPELHNFNLVAFKLHNKEYIYFQQTKTACDNVLMLPVCVENIWRRLTNKERFWDKRIYCYPINFLSKFIYIGKMKELNVVQTVTNPHFCCWYIKTIEEDFQLKIQNQGQ